MVNRLFNAVTYGAHNISTHVLCKENKLTISATSYGLTDEMPFTLRLLKDE